MEHRISLKSLYDLQLNNGQIEGIPANPRTIKKADFKKLVNSVLLFPGMLEIRPITIYRDVVLGGNQRTRALESIAPMSSQTIAEKLTDMVDYRNRSAEEQAAIFEFWCEFLKDPEKNIPVQEITTANLAELKEFIIKDNIPFGEHDYDALANTWNIESLKNWGLTIPKNWEAPEDLPQDDKAKNTKKSIQISFEAEDYVEAYRQIQWFRDNNIYIGHDVLQFLKDLKRQNE